MITVNGWYVGGIGGVGKWGDESSGDGGDEERLLFKLPPTLS